jgi:hypothetical protein
MALNSFFSPNGFSVGNLFNPTNVVWANGDITAGNTVTANYFLGNGSFLTGIVTGNTTVSNTSPVGAQQGDIWIQANTGIQYIYFTSDGNSQWAEMEAALSISSGSDYGNADVAAYLLTYTGNISAGNVTISSGGNVFLPGNIVAGYRDIPQIDWTGTPTIAFSDAGKHYYTNAGGLTLNIPNNSSVNLPIGAAISLINQSTSNCTIGQLTGVTLYLAGNATAANRTLSHYGFASLVKVAANIWFISGSNVI